MLCTVKDVAQVRKDTKVGQHVKFKIYVGSDFSRLKMYKIIEGTVTKKYPYIFMLDNNTSYQWVDLCLHQLKTAK